MKLCTKWFASFLLLALSGTLHAALPHLELEVSLDPQTRAFRATGELSGAPGNLQLSLNPIFTIARTTRTPQRLRIEYSGTLPPLPQRDQRGSPAQSGLYASPEGSYLSAGAGWYPDPGGAFTYRVKLSLPTGQKGLVPGDQLRVTDGAAGFTAEYRFAHPAEGLWLMTGPYQVAQQALKLEDGTPVTVRTWFHAELAGLADGYLQDSARYIQRYSRQIGNYPFGDFSVVSSPLPHGLGMPSLTYLGRDVLRLPFIRATSLGHEVLHNWWGNGVYPDWNSGNWSEGLTTFMADYAYREDQSEAAAREMRLSWLRDLAAIAPADETALAAFTARHHGISSVIGYSKSAMLFFMLRDEIGRPAFDEGLRLFWQGQRFKIAGWKDLEAAFSRAARRDLSGFFAQWVRRPASARLELAPRRAADPARSFRVVQQGEPFDLLVPLRFWLPSGAPRDVGVRVRERDTLIDPAAAGVPADVTQVELDTDLRLWRRLDPRSVPPILREVFIAPRAQLVLATAAPEWRGPATALAGRLLDATPREVTEAELHAAPELPALVLGDRAGIARVLAGLGMAGLPDVLLQGSAAAGGEPRPLKGTARAWTARSAGGKTLAFVLADSAQELAALQRALPHYGRQSWLVFQDGRMVEQGSWPVTPQRLPLTERGP